MTESKTDTIVYAYVRLCGGEDRQDDCREISIRTPEGISQAELLEEGFAIDGNSALMSVTPYTNSTTGDWVPLGDALRDTQMQLVGWFAERGFTLEFK